MKGPMVKGWCPGALRPMESGDGLIVRLKISGGIVGIDCAAEIARWSMLWGNGQIDLTSRANLQLRGLSARTFPHLQAALAERGLLAETAAGDAVRNIISSPLAGLDPDAVLDARPVMKSLERRLIGDTVLHGLPGKFGFLIDDGGRLGLDGVAADIRFEAQPTAEGRAFEIRLDGAGEERFGPCPPDAVAEVAAALGSVFLGFRHTGIRRMRDLAARLGPEPIAQAAGLRYMHSARRGRPALPSAFMDAQPLGLTAFFGAGLPFGRVAAKDFAEFTEAAARHGAKELRLTPWRAILVPLPSIRAAREMSAWSAKKSPILDPGDPRRRVAACTGAPSCMQATTDVRGNATVLAASIGGAPGSGIVLHVSGCAKGCAHPHVTPITLVGRGGRYDLVVSGGPSDSALLRNLNVDQAAEQVRGIMADQAEESTA